MNAFLVAWRWAPRLPVPVVRAGASAVAWAAWATRGRVVTRLEDNLVRVTGRDGTALRRLSRRSLASTARYYAEILELGRLTPEQIDARVRVDGIEVAHDALYGDGPAIAVLGHNGNWDLIGAYASRHIIPVTAVAEVLEPREVFDEFVQMRERVGIHVLGHEGGSTFRELIRLAKGERALLCLLSDRDISGSGLEVTMWGRAVKVAPGPAALASATGVPIVPVMIHYERLTGARRRQAGSRWGCVLSFGPPLHPRDYAKDGRIEAMSQDWAAWLAEQVTRHPEDWHMLQRFGWVA